MSSTRHDTVARANKTLPPYPRPLPTRPAPTITSAGCVSRFRLRALPPKKSTIFRIVVRVPIPNRDSPFPSHGQPSLHSTGTSNTSQSTCPFFSVAWHRAEEAEHVSASIFDEFFACRDASIDDDDKFRWHRAAPLLASPPAHHPSSGTTPHARAMVANAGDGENGRGGRGSATMHRVHYDKRRGVRGRPKTQQSNYGRHAGEEERRRRRRQRCSTAVAMTAPRAIEGSHGRADGRGGVTRSTTHDGRRTMDTRVRRTTTTTTI